MPLVTRCACSCVTFKNEPMAQSVRTSIVAHMPWNVPRQKWYSSCHSSALDEADVSMRPPELDNERDPTSADQRRDEILKRMLNPPPQPRPKPQPGAKRGRPAKAAPKGQ